MRGGGEATSVSFQVDIYQLSSHGTLHCTLTSEAQQFNAKA